MATAPASHPISIRVPVDRRLRSSTDTTFENWRLRRVVGSRLSVCALRQRGEARSDYNPAMPSLRLILLTLALTAPTFAQSTFQLHGFLSPRQIYTSGQPGWLQSC